MSDIEGAIFWGAVTGVFDDDEKKRSSSRDSRHRGNDRQSIKQPHVPVRAKSSFWYDHYIKKIRQGLQVNVKPTEIEEYESWLDGYLSSRGEFSSSSNSFYESNSPLFTVQGDGIFRDKLTGANAVSLFIPEGIEVSGPVGHCKLYFMDGFRLDGTSGATYYKDLDVRFAHLRPRR
jgi:hypothetical protein